MKREGDEREGIGGEGWGVVVGDGEVFVRERVWKGIGREGTERIRGEGI